MRTMCLNVFNVFKYDFSQWPKTVYNTYVYKISVNNTFFCINICLLHSYISYYVNYNLYLCQIYSKLVKEHLGNCFTHGKFF